MRRFFALCALTVVISSFIGSPVDAGTPKGKPPSGESKNVPDITGILNQTAFELGLEHEDLSKRQQEYLNNYQGPNGKVRPDLWQKGNRENRRLEVSATWRAVPHVRGSWLANPGSAPSHVGPSGAGASNPIVGSQWTQIGPAPLRVDDKAPFGDNFTFQGDGPASGEVVDIAIDPRNTTDRTVYIATNGGIWKTTNGGNDWEPLTDNLATLSFGAVAVDPSTPQTVYAGTGNGMEGGCFFTKSVGVYKSTDGGATWSLLGGALFNNVMINQIVVLTSGVLLVATNNGLFRSVDGGANFGNNAPLFNNNTAVLGGNATDLDVATNNANTVFASIATRDRCGRAGPGGTSGVFQSTDGGATFPTNLFTNPGAPAANRGYISFAQGTDDPTRFYASVANASNNWDGLYRSVDSGANWTNPAGADTPAAASGSSGCQCAYDQELGVDPLDATRVYIGFQEFWLSTDSGNNFAGTAITSREVHWDQHAMAFSPAAHVPSGATTTPLWIGNDGGVSFTSDGGTNWDNKNEGIATNLYKEIDIGRGAGNTGFTYGGAQDTGTTQRRPAYAGNDWHLGIDGDGLTVAVDPGNPNHALAADNGNLIVTTNGGDDWTLPGPRFGLLKWDPSDANNVWAAGPTNGFGSGPQLSRSTNNGSSFSASPVATLPATIQAIEVDRQDSNTVWLGLSNGTVQRSTNALAASPTWAAVTTPGPGQPVGDIAVDPTDSNTAVVTYTGFTGTAAGLRTQHVFRTTDAGSTWTDISGTDGGSENLPDLPVKSVVIDGGTTPPSIIVANDVSVLRSVDNGASWQRLGTGLPNVDSVTLALDDSVTPPILRIGTYGRSVFELTPASGPALAVNGDLNFDHVAVGRRATRQVELFNVGTSDLHVVSFTRLNGSPEFSIISGPATPVTVQPGEHIDYTVEFKPTSAGDKTATFRIQSDDPNSPTDLPASGTGVTGVIRLTGNLNFGTVARGTSSARPVDIENIGEGFLHVSAWSMTGDSRFTIDEASPGSPIEIAPGSKITIHVRFLPLATDGPGTHTATLHVTNDTPGNTDATKVATGDVGVPQTGVSSSSLNFGGVPVDDRTTPHFRDLIVTVFNQASCNLCDVNVTGLAITGPQAADFSVVSPPALPYKIGAGNHLDVMVRFDPRDSGVRVATLTISSDDPGNPSVAVALAGSGLIPGISTPHDTTVAGTLYFPPTVYTPVCVAPCGTTINEPYQNNGAAELIVDSIAFTGSTAFSGPPATSPPSRFAPNSGGNEPILFKPTAAARKLTGTMTITDTMGPSPTAAPVTRQVALCGESVGRGFRVLAVDAAGTPFTQLKSLKLMSHGFRNNVNENLKNVNLTTIDPPTVCRRVQFQYENQNLPDTARAGNQGAYYDLTITVGNKAKTISFALGTNEFKEIVMTIP